MFVKTPMLYETERFFAGAPTSSKKSRRVLSAMSIAACQLVLNLTGLQLVAYYISDCQGKFNMIKY